MASPGYITMLPTLHAFQVYLNGGSVFASEPIVHMVFDKVAGAIDGQDFDSWISPPTSDADASRRLDQSNSGIDPRRCIIADHRGSCFLLIDQINVDETLYTFRPADVEKISFNESMEHQLQLREGFVAECVGRSFTLERDRDSAPDLFR
ncbi:MAG: hypothetical protein Q9219_000441 [cf. Caloplaca sp. 3 TL-2023]